jgi:hypothetical protein
MICLFLDAEQAGEVGGCSSGLEQEDRAVDGIAVRGEGGFRGLETGGGRVSSFSGDQGQGDSWHLTSSRRDGLDLQEDLSDFVNGPLEATSIIVAASAR